MPSYHIHDQGPGPLSDRILLGDNRYSVCKGTAEDCAASKRPCSLVGVASSMRGVRDLVAKQEREHREGRDRPYWEYPAIPVGPDHAHATPEEAADCRTCSPSSLPRRIEGGT